jgi:membrane protein YdbS with pleckstrin-like domain
MNDRADADRPATESGDDGDDDGLAVEGSEPGDEATAGETGPGDRSATDAPAAEAGALAEEPLGERRHLDGKVRAQWFVGRLFAALFSAAGVVVLYQFAGGRLGLPAGDPVIAGIGRNAVTVGMASLAVFLVISVGWILLLYRSWRYVVREDSLYLTRGVLTRVQTVAPYVRVQHIDTRRSPVERLLGLSSLVVYTAGSRGADVTIPGLTDERAAELQRRLKRLAIESEEEDAV